MRRLDGKVALITSSGRGQEQAAAPLFAREGARVVVGATPATPVIRHIFLLDTDRRVRHAALDFHPKGITR